MNLIATALPPDSGKGNSFPSQCFHHNLHFVLCLHAVPFEETEDVVGWPEGFPEPLRAQLGWFQGSRGPGFSADSKHEGATGHK